jgi:tetratricopeptide (TPR) repeat protein
MRSYLPTAALPPHVLERRDVCEALARHDFGRVFALARKWGGISFSKIAESTGIKPERVGSLAKGRGSITTYSKITEIADGLRIPGHLLGLTARPWERTDGASLVHRHLPQPRATTEDAEVRRLLTHAAEVTMGVGRRESANRWPAGADEATPPPARVLAGDVAHIEEVTAELRARDYQYGGGACREAVLAQTRWVARLLDADASDRVRRRLHLTLADLHNLAGWTSLDVGLYSAARRHFGQALTQSRVAEAPSLMANVLYRTGRLHLHRGMLKEALRFFQLGQIAAQDSGDAAAVAVLCANEAWTYGYMGEATPATHSLNRATDEFARAERAAAAPWVTFFGEIELQAMTGLTQLELSAHDPKLVPSARTTLTATVQARGEQMARSHAFDTTALAVACLRDGDEVEGLRLGHEAASMADNLRSGRVVDRLGPLAVQAGAATASDAGDLVQRITTLQHP